MSTYAYSKTIELNYDYAASRNRYVINNLHSNTIRSLQLSLLHVTSVNVRSSNSYIDMYNRCIDLTFSKGLNQ